MGLRHLSDQVLVHELKERGFKVYAPERVSTITYNVLRPAQQVAGCVGSPGYFENISREVDHGIVHFLRNEGFIVMDRTRDDSPNVHFSGTMVAIRPKEKDDG